MINVLIDKVWLDSENCIKNLGNFFMYYVIYARVPLHLISKD